MSEGTAGNPVQISCLFTLVIYSHEEKRIEHFKKMFKKISEKFPCRMIFIQQISANDKGLVKIVKNEELNSPGEQYILKVSQEQLEQVPFVVLPLLIPDLPIYLVWGQNPALDKSILPHLQNFATRLVYDSDCDRDLQHFSQTMVEKITELKCDFMDIDWAAISGWRDVLSQTFDNQMNFEFLQNCRSVEIKYNLLESPSIQRKTTQAIYLQGWLAAQLGWKYQSLQINKDHFKVQYVNNNHDIIVTLNPIEKQNILTGTIFEVNLISLNDKSISLSLDEKQSKVLVYLSTPERCDLPFSLPFVNLQRSLAFMKEVFYHRADQHYLNMLKTISAIPWSGQTS